MRSKPSARQDSLKTGQAHVEEMNDLCLGIWSRGGGPDSAKLVRLRVGRTRGKQDLIRDGTDTGASPPNTYAARNACHA